MIAATLVYLAIGALIYAMGRMLETQSPSGAYGVAPLAFLAFAWAPLLVMGAVLLTSDLVRRWMVGR